MLKDASLDIADCTEPVVFQRCGSEERYDSAAALKRHSKRQEQHQNFRLIPQQWCHWFLPIRELPVVPRAEDEILDTKSNRWIIHSVEETESTGTWKCIAYYYDVQFGPEECVDLFRKESTKTPAGTEESRWALLQSNIPAKFSGPVLKREPFAMGTQVNNPKPTEERYILIRSPLALEPDDRFRTPDGSFFQIQKIEYPNLQNGWIEILATNVV